MILDKKTKYVTAFTFPPSICQEVMGLVINLYAEYIMRNAGLEKVRAGMKIARRNINNLRYADATTLMAESKDELRSLLMKVKE